MEIKFVVLGNSKNKKTFVLRQCFSFFAYIVHCFRFEGEKLTVKSKVLYVGNCIDTICVFLTCSNGSSIVSDFGFLVIYKFLSEQRVCWKTFLVLHTVCPKFCLITIERGTVSSLWQSNNSSFLSIGGSLDSLADAISYFNQILFNISDSLSSIRPTRFSLLF